MDLVLREEPTLTMDGSAGEGGGQILRTSLALSMLLGKPFVLERIRAGRKKPGLMRQHLTCVRAAAQVCNADVEGADLGSPRLSFKPGHVAGGRFEFDVGSAGSTGLVLQTIALPLLATSSAVTIRGGTHALWAPIYEFLERAWMPLLRGAQMTMELKRVGFYPAGGGELVMHCQPSHVQPLHLTGRSEQVELGVDAIVANLGASIARREVTSAAALLRGRVRTGGRTVESAGPGNAVWIEALDHKTGVCNVFSAIGERGVSATEVGASCAHAFLRWRASGASVEEHLADQLMLPMLLASEGSFTCSELTLHSRTNIEVIHAFTGKRLHTRALEGGSHGVELRR